MIRFARPPDSMPVVALEPGTLGEMRSGRVQTTSKDYVLQQNGAGALPHETFLGPLDPNLPMAGDVLQAKSPAHVQLEWFYCAEILAATDLQQHRQYQRLGTSKKYQNARRPENQSPVWQLGDLQTMRMLLEKFPIETSQVYYSYDPAQGQTDVLTTIPQPPMPLTAAYWLAGRASATWAHLAATNLPTADDSGQMEFTSQIRYDGPPVGYMYNLSRAIQLNSRELDPLDPAFLPMLVPLGLPPPSLELHLLDFVHNTGPRYSAEQEKQDPPLPLVMDQDERQKVAGGLQCLGVQYSQVPELGTAAMQETGAYVTFEQWLSKGIGNGALDPLGSTADTCRAMRENMQLLDLLAGSAKDVRQQGDPPAGLTGALGQVAKLRSSLPSEICLPQYFVDQDMRAPLLHEHSEQLQRVGQGLSRWREMLFASMGAMLGQEAEVSWMDGMSERLLLLSGEPYQPMPGIGGLISLSDDPAAVSRHSGAVLQLARADKTAAEPWFDCVHDARTLALNTPICVQEMRMYLMWAIQCRLDIIRLERLAKAVPPPPPPAPGTGANPPIQQQQQQQQPERLRNLEWHFKTLIGGCCMAVAPLNSWMVPALYYFFLRSMPDVETMWGGGPAEDRLIGELPEILRTYVREKWFYTMRQDMRAAHYQNGLGRLGLKGAGYRDRCYEHMLLALVAERHRSDLLPDRQQHYDEVRDYLQAHPDTNAPPTPHPYKDVLQAIESTVAWCMQFWAGQGEQALQECEDYVLSPEAIPDVRTQLATPLLVNQSVYAVDCMKLWVQTGLVDGIEAALASGATPFYDLWPLLKSKRTRGPLSTQYALYRPAALFGLLRPAEGQLTFALRANFPALAAALGLNAMYSRVPRPRHLFRVQAQGDTVPFESSDWDTENELDMFAVSSEQTQRRAAYLQRQGAIEHSALRADFGQQWLRGPGAARIWDASHCDLGIKAVCLFPSHCTEMQLTWQVVSGSGNDNQRRTLRSARLKLPEGAQVSNVAPLQWARDTLYISMTDASYENQPNVFSVYGSAKGINPRQIAWHEDEDLDYVGDQQRGEDLRRVSDLVDFSLSLTLTVETVDPTKAPSSRTERCFTVHGKGYSTSRSVIFFEVVHQGDD